VKKENFYIQEAIHQAEYALMAYSKYEKALREKDTKLVFYNLHHFVIHITNIDKILFPKNNDFRDSILLNIQKLINIDIKPIKRLRNHLEHFDERIDSYVKNYKGQAYFDNNIVTGTKGFPKNNCLRALDGNIYIFYGEEFDLGEIYQHLQPLTKVLQNAV